MGLGVSAESGNNGSDGYVGFGTEVAFLQELQNQNLGPVCKR